EIPIGRISHRAIPAQYWVGFFGSGVWAQAIWASLPAGKFEDLLGRSGIPTLRNEADVGFLLRFAAQALREQVTHGSALKFVYDRDLRIFDHRAFLNFLDEGCEGLLNLDGQSRYLERVIFTPIEV